MKCHNFVLIAIIVLFASSAYGIGSAARHDFPKIGSYNVLVCDFHMHTINSDGSLTTRQRVEESYALGYDVIAITDHGKTRAFRVANNVGSQLGMVVLRGVETGIANNEHLNAIGFSEQYSPTDPHMWSRKKNSDTIFYMDELKNIARYGGFVIYNHPYYGFSRVIEAGIKEGLIQGVEVMIDTTSADAEPEAWHTTEVNGSYCYPNHFDYALKNNLTLFANTDVHKKRNPNPAKTIVLATAKTPEAVMDALRNRRTVAWFGGMLWGREELLADLMRASVSVCRDNNTVVLENRSPVAFKGVIEGNSERRFDLPAYGSISVELTGTDSFDVGWDNVWTGSTSRLKLKMKAELR